MQIYARKYAILNSGFLLRGPYMDWTKETPQDFDFDYEEMPVLDTPILHLIGKNDVVVVPERTGLLMKFSRNKKVLVHAGGMQFLFIALNKYQFLSSISQAISSIHSHAGEASLQIFFVTR